LGVRCKYSCRQVENGCGMSHAVSRPASSGARFQRSNAAHRVDRLSGPVYVALEFVKGYTPPPLPSKSVDVATRIRIVWVIFVRVRPFSVWQRRQVTVGNLSRAHTPAFQIVLRGRLLQLPQGTDMNMHCEKKSKRSSQRKKNNKWNIKASRQLETGTSHDKHIHPPSACHLRHHLIRAGRRAVKFVFGCRPNCWQMQLGSQVTPNYCEG
jgi:hypothetical protein